MREDYRAIIRDVRIARGLSQNKLAKLVGISQPFMREIECGRKNPSSRCCSASATSSESGSLLKWRHKRKPGGSKGSFRLFVRVRAPD